MAHSLHPKVVRDKTHSFVKAERARGHKHAGSKPTSTTCSRRCVVKSKRDTSHPRYSLCCFRINGGFLLKSFDSPPSSSLPSAVKQFSFFLYAGQVAQTAGVSAQLSKLTHTHAHTHRHALLKVFKTSTRSASILVLSYRKESVFELTLLQ